MQKSAGPRLVPLRAKVLRYMSKIFYGQSKRAPALLRSTSCKNLLIYAESLLIPLQKPSGPRLSPFAKALMVNV